MRIIDAVEELRQRYFLAKRAKSVVTVATKIGVTRQTLAKFEQEGFVSPPILALIEAWVEAYEQQRGGAHGDTP